jgi:hypothetical protein
MTRMHYGVANGAWCSVSEETPFKRRLFGFISRLVGLVMASSVGRLGWRLRRLPWRPLYREAVPNVEGTWNLLRFSSRDGLVGFVIDYADGPRRPRRPFRIA